MKLISRTMLGVGSAVVGGLLVVGAFQLNLLGRETNNVPPKFKVQETPVNRDARGVTSYSPIIKKAAPSVVNIYSERTVRVPRMQMPFFFFDGPFGPEDFGQQPNPRNRGRSEGQPLTRKERSLGSGVIVSPEGYIITANHVIADADEDGVKVQLGGSAREFPARVIGKDPQTDIAVLKIEGENLQAITLADSDKLEVGDVVLAIGNPFGLSQSVSMGIVSATGRTALGIIRNGEQRGYENFIQTDAPINQGNSGGALIDAEGRLVGINTAIFSPSGGNAGIGFAVPVNMARNVR
jgi:serine protease Do